MKKAITTFVWSLLILVPVMAQAQTLSVTGTIIDSDTREPLAGASVVVAGTSIGTATSMDGTYQISAPENATLRFSFIGYIAQEIPVEGRSVINVSLAPDFRQLDEVVVVGYGSQLERTLTGNIARVSARELEDQTVLSVEQALQGRMAGVDIQTQSGKLGQGIQVRVRGASSVSASNQPLYVIDGIPVTTQNLSNNDAATNPMADINPNDIESIQVLKDASAAAIYGARASNGVVLITTKSGAVGATRITANYSRSWSAPTNRVDFMTGPEYVDFMMEAAENTAALDGGDPYYVAVLTEYLDDYSSGADWRSGQANFDWQDQAFQSGGSNTFELTAQGGDQRTRFFISGAIDDQDGILVGNHYQRLSGRANIDHDVSDRLNVGARLSLTRSINQRLAIDNAFATPMQMVAQMPVTPIYEPDPNVTDGYAPSDNVNHNTVYFNSLLYVDNTRFNTTVYRTLGNAFANLEITPGLRFHSEFGVDVLDQNDDQHYNSQVARGMTDAVNGLGFQGWDRVVNYTTNNYFNYVGGFGDDHSYDATVGTSFQNADWNWSSVTGTQFPSDDFTQISSAAEITSGAGGTTSYRFLSYFGRVNYQFMDRYLLTLSGRYDGSSRFGSNNRYGFFPAVSAGWIISDESFMEEGPFSLLKLRASYGLTGNAEIGNFDSRGLWSAGAYGGRPGTYPSQTPNPDLAWERTQQFDVGVDFGLFDDRVAAQFDYYYKDTQDLLLNVTVPASTGFTSQTRNVGRLRNQGIEIAINTRNIVSNDFSWNSNFVFGRNRNEVTDLDGQVINGGFINRAVEGQPIGVFYSLEYAGVDPDNGDALFYINDQDDDGNIVNAGATTNNPNAANQVVIGDPNADFTGGFGNEFTYRGFSLDVLFQFSYGNDVYDGAGIYKSANGDFFDNQHASQLDRWQQPGDVTDVPQARFLMGNGVVHSSRYLYDGSYLRLRHVALSYQLPRQYIDGIGLQNARIYVTGQNLLTWTKYPWWDPEVNADFAAGNIGLGNEFYTAPQARSVTTGIQLTF